MDSKNIKSVLKTQTKVIAYVVICLVIIVVGISYSLYSEVEHNSTNQVVKAGTLQFEYSGGTEIKDNDKADCFAQMTADDAQKLTNCIYTVTVKNTGTLPAKYSLTLKKKDSTNHVDLNKLKVILKQGDVKANGFPKTVDETTGNLVNNATLAANASITYTIQVYVDDQAAVEGDNEKNISLQVEGTAEVSASEINPAVPTK